MQTGRITVITGPMFSEKSGELIRRCQKLIQFGRKRSLLTNQPKMIGLLKTRLSAESDIVFLPIPSPAINSGIRGDDSCSDQRC